MAELADVPTERVRRLNAGYKRPVSPQSGPYQLVLPKDKAQLFQQRYAALGSNRQQTLIADASTTEVSTTPANTPATVSSTTVATKGTDNKQAHKVQQGETLWGIARQYQVDVHRLAAWNNMTANSSLQLGQTLNLFNDQ